MKRFFALGIIFAYLALFAILYPIWVNNTPEIKTVEFEAIDVKKTANEQEVMDALVKETEEKPHEDCGITYEEARMLMKIAMAEAEGDGIEGQAMVMAVVLNRVKDDRFPDSIEEVIFQEGQFSPITDGRYNKVEPDLNSHLALAEIEKGNYDDVEALYFENAGSCWQSKNCEYLGTVGHHKFYKN